MKPTFPPLLAADEEAMLLAFEAGWESGAPPDVASFVPADAGIDFLHELIHIDLERRLSAGLPVHLYTYLATFPVLRSDEAIWRNLMEAEIALRERFHRPPSSTGRPLVPPTQTERDTGKPVCLTLPVIPGYLLLRVLGSGGMSVVYEAEDRRSTTLTRDNASESGSPAAPTTPFPPLRGERGWPEGGGHERSRVAVKLIKAGAIAGEEARRRFRQEIAALAQLRHVNVVTVLDSGTTADGQDYLVMEYLGGGSLPDTVRSPGEAAALIETLARAVGYLHQHKIVHRDLKPSNVLLTNNGTMPKITDFGLAKCVDLTITSTTGLVGTPLYMSPEQVNPKLVDKVGPACDVYALGVMLYRFLCGAFPVPVLTAETIGRLLHEDPIPLGRQNPAVPPDLRTICHKCLEKQPSRRYVTGDDLADDLRRYRQHQRIAARPVTSLGRLVRRAERNPSLATAIGLLLVISLIASGGAAWGAWKYTADLRTARNVAENNRREADRQRKVALDNLRLVIADINDLENRHPEAEDVRQELLLRAQKYLSPMLEDPAHLAQADETDFWLEIDIGDVLRVQERRIDAALDHYRRALAIADGVANDGEPVRTQQRLRSFAVSRLGDAYATQGHLDQAQEQYQTMLALREQLYAARTDRESRADLAVAHLKIGGGYRRLYGVSRQNEHLETASEHITSSYELYESLAQEFPDDVWYARMMGYVWEHLADAQIDRGERVRAIEACQAGLDFLRCARQRFHEYEMIFDIQSSYFLDRLGVMYGETGQFDLARQAADEALRFGLELVSRNPRSNLFKLCLAHSYERIGDTLRGLGRFDEALASYEKGFMIHKDLKAADPGSKDAQDQLINCTHQVIQTSYLVVTSDDRTVGYSEERIATRKKVLASPTTSGQESHALFHDFQELGDYHLLQGRPAEAARLYQEALQFKEGARAIDWTDHEQEKMTKRLELCTRANLADFDPAAELVGLAWQREFLMRMQQEFQARQDHVRLARVSDQLAGQSDSFTPVYAAARGFAQAAVLAPPGDERQKYDERCKELITRLLRFSEEAGDRIRQDPAFSRYSSLSTTTR